ncbi:MAG: DUF2589 domain-containing protein [Anaerolineae bacterium]|nr:DUF2589 domain-containing protein [Anaerolineae bacterium]NIN95879.1 DUF2589 domain-containing protein [Anaerolineae bacterium]NIQ78851.1 DUF2589 domain-containing protein [Anaerolineae bacterium]
MAIASEMSALDMGALIGGPLMAAVDADCAAGLKSFQFLEEHLLNDDGNGKKSARVVNFSLKKGEPQDDGTVKQTTTDLQVPLAVLAPPGTVRVKTCDVNFTMEVKTQEVDKSSTTSSASISGSAGFAWWKVSIKGSVSHQREHTRSTDKTAKYEVKVHAEQQEMPEGMSRLMDIFAQAVSPMAQSSSGGSQE